MEGGGASSHQDYLQTKINPLLEALVTQLLTDTPDEPIPFMIKFLCQRANLPYPGEATDVEDEDLDDDDEEDDDDVVDDLPDLPPTTAHSRPRQSVSAEAYGAWNKKKAFTPPVHPKTEGQKSRIRAILADSFMFSNIEEKDMVAVINAFQEKVVEGKTHVITQGEDGDVLYVIESGTLGCYIKTATSGEEKCVKTCTGGDLFGELALLYNCPRAASVISEDKCVLWQLDRETFNHIVKEAASKKRELYESFLSSVPLLKSMDTYERSKLADALKTESYKDGTFIVREGDPGDKFYIVEEGAAAATKTFVPGQIPSEVMQYKVGDYFGELALLKNEPRAANVVARGECKVAWLDRRSFKRLLGSLEDILRRNTERYAQ